MSEDSFPRLSPSSDGHLRTLLELEAFRVCPPLKVTEFESWCKACGLAVGIELLEQLEKKGIFMPLFRVRLPVHREKMRHVEGGVERLGELREGEDWEGQVETSYVWPDFSRHRLLEWMDEGLLFSPEGRPFIPWEEYQDESHQAAVATYYSRFQIFTLAYQLTTTTFELSLAFIIDYSSKDFAALEGDLAEIAEFSCSPQSRLDNPRFDTEILSQAIASRYYPLARGDLRRITLPGDWDWYGYSRRWDASSVVANFGISPEGIKRHVEELVDPALYFDDPLEDWDDLLRFVKREARDRLKGKARYGEELRAMREMLSSLYKDMTGGQLDQRKGSLTRRYTLNKSSRLARTSELTRAKAPTEVDLLEFVVSRYGLNPRPALVLFVEGEGEREAIPRLVERAYGHSLAVAGIEVRNLGGVSGFTGKKGQGRHGALEKVVEDLHWNQTVVFVILDNEGGASQVRRRLSGKVSKYLPKRTVIRREFVHIWNCSIEFDNFTSEEIAAALTTTAEERFHFTAEQVTQARLEFGRKGDPLSKLFEDHVRYSLPKPRLLCELVDRLPLREPESRDRPLLVLLGEIMQIAALNHKATFVDTWYENQESGYLGHPVDGREDRMAHNFKVLRTIQTHLDGTDGKADD